MLAPREPARPWLDDLGETHGGPDARSAADGSALARATWRRARTSPHALMAARGLDRSRSGRCRRYAHDRSQGRKVAIENALAAGRDEPSARPRRRRPAHARRTWWAMVGPPLDHAADPPHRSGARRRSAHDLAGRLCCSAPRRCIAPQLSKINPLSGFKRIFGLTALVKAGLDSAKVLIVGADRRPYGHGLPGGGATSDPDVPVPAA